jgi:hypothetical protein
VSRPLVGARIVETHLAESVKGGVGCRLVSCLAPSDVSGASAIWRYARFLDSVTLREMDDLITNFNNDKSAV